jgi:DNA polymerase
MTGLKVIARDIRNCTLCPLATGRSAAVPGEGPSKARLMFVGEAPGQQEDTAGKPFLGRSGKVLEQALKDAGIRRNEVFITNVVKCRPPNNRLPLKNEIHTCVAAHLNRQIQAIKPEIICLLGITAVKAFMGGSRFSAIRGRVLLKERNYFATYHPAAAGRSAACHRTFQSDIKALEEFLRENSRTSHSGP